MSKFTLSFDTDNDAYRHEDGDLNIPAVANTMRWVASRLDDYQSDGLIRDDNGNTVGSFRVTE